LKAPPQKKPRILKVTPAKTGLKAAKRTRKPKGGDTGEPFDAEKLAKDTHISGDNPLFSTSQPLSTRTALTPYYPDTIVNSSANLQSTIEDFLESLSQSPEHALAELINCILRCCGCSDTVNSDQVMDYDGIVVVLEDVTEALKNVSA
jgi:cohesin complex subunit SA-1/2